jgi:hypothetical protein
MLDSAGNRMLGPQDCCGACMTGEPSYRAESQGGAGPGQKFPTVCLPGLLFISSHFFSP